MVEVFTFLQRAWDRIDPWCAFIWSGFCWLLFPEAAYAPAAIAVGIAILLDLGAKLDMLSVRYGGYRQAVRKGMISSDILWHQTRTKLVAYLGTMILAGLAVRVAPLRLLGSVVGTIADSVMFIPELQSVTENSVEAGAEGLRPLLFYLRRKEKDILDSKAREETTEEGDG